MTVRILFLGTLGVLFVLSMGMAQSIDPTKAKGFPKGFNMGSPLNKKELMPEYNPEKIIDSNIKSLTIWQYDASPGKTPGEIIETNGAKLSTSTFTEEGYPLEAIAVYPETGAEVKTSFVYNDSGYIQEATMTSIEKVMNQRVVYKYGAKSYLTGIKTYSLDGDLTMELEYAYDMTSGLLLESSSSVLGGRMMLRTVYDYDEEGRIVSAIGYDSVQGTNIIKTEINYSPDGWEVINYGPDGNIVEKTVNVNDSYGNIGEVIRYDAQNRIVSKATNTYDDEGNLLEAVSTMPAANLKTRVTSKYDADGNVMEAVSYNKLDEPVKMLKYEYERFE